MSVLGRTRPLDRQAPALASLGQLLAALLAADLRPGRELRVEHPIYTQVVYCLTRVPVAAKANPHLAKVEPFKTVLTGYFEKVANLSLRKLDVIPAATLTGMDVDTFETDVKSWLDSAKHPR